MKLSKKKVVVLLLVICILIATIPLLMNRDSEFGGADGQAEDLISVINPDYEAWADPIMEPPGGETESLLFCLQAALGAGVFGYGLGVLKERNRKENKSE